MRIVVAAVTAVAIVVVLSCRRRPLILLCRSNTAAPSPSCSSVTYPYRRRCRRCRHRLALGIVHRGFIDSCIVLQDTVAAFAVRPLQFVRLTFTTPTVGAIIR